MPKPILKFRISAKYYDKKLSCPFLFYIWENKQDLKTHNGKAYHAVTFDKSMESAASKTIEIHLAKDRLSLSYVVHEIFHAIIFWANRNHFNIQEDDKNYVAEECCASLCGALVQKFYEKLYKLKFIEDADFVTSKEYPKYRIKEMK